MPAFADVSSFASAAPSVASALDALRSSGALLFGQNARLLRLRFAEGAGIGAETLLPHRMHGEEGLSSGYRYLLDCLSPDTHLELKALLGQPVEIGLLLPDGGERLYTGLVTRAEQVGADGGFGLFSLTVEPALATLAHRRNSRVWQDKTVPQIVTELLAEHQSINPAFARSFVLRDTTTRSYPARSYCLQYRETDLAFIERLLAEEGIATRYVHGPDPDTSLRETDAPADDGVPRHTLILFDDNFSLPGLTSEHEIGRTGQSAPQALRFHRTAGVESDDALDVWHGTRQLQSGRTTLLSYDYKSVAAHTGGSDAAAFQGEAGDPVCAALEDYDPQTLYYGQDPDEITRYAALRQSARDRAAKTFFGEGSVRRLLAGGWFPLADHPLHDADPEEDRQFLVTKLTFAARNNLLAESDDPFPLPEGSLLAAGGEAGTGTGAGAKNAQSATPYRARIEAIRKHIRFVPDYSRTAHQKPTAPGGTTATVVGPDGEEIHTDEHGRIKLQFHWQRREDHPDGGADWDERSSTWVRVAYPSAGAAWGTQYIPRIGQEVLVSFLENDIDRPVVTGVLHNGTHRPPEFSAAGRLPANKMLSGHKSKEYKGSGWNELVFDDSTGELRTRLSSEHGKTQLNQGYLIHPRTDGKGEPRGEGFELRTDESGAIRAAKGLLLSTDARLKAQGKQLDRAELVGILRVLESLQQHLANLANTHQADETDTQELTKLKQHLENWEKGSNTAGSSADPAGGQPVIAATAPAGFVVGSASNVALAAESHIDLVSNQNVQMSVGRRWLVRAAESISLFAHRAQMKLIAASGKVEIQAHNNNIEATAAKKIVLTGLEEIVLNAPKISFVASGARIDLGSGAITTQCSGTHEQKAGFHKLTGPGDGSVGGQLPGSDAAYDEKYKLRFANGMPVANTPALIKDAKGKTLWQGVTNARGEADILKKDLPENLRIEFGKKA